MGCLVQTRGVWMNRGGVKANFLYFSRADELPDISKIYFDLESLEKLGCNVCNDANYAHPYNRVLDCLLENPGSDLTKDIFRDFIGSLQVKETCVLNEDIRLESCINLEDIKEGCPSQLRAKEAHDFNERLDEECVNINIKINSDEEFNNDYLDYGEDEDLQDITLDDLDEYSDDEVTRPGKRRKLLLAGESVRGYTKKKEYPPTLAEKRLLTRCQELDKSEKLEDYFSSPNLDDGSISCRLCSKKFTSSIVQTASLRISLIERVVDHVLVKHFKSYAYQCDLCKAEFKSPKPWKDHVRSKCEQTSITQIGRFVCKKCKERFEDKKDLNEHVMTVHDVESADTLICRTCGLMFKTEKCRVDHEKRIHKTVFSSERSKQKRDRNLPNGGAPRVVCPTCGFECCTKWVLENHIKKWHENAFPEPKICELCVKPDSSNFSRRKYYTPYSLEKHKREYHGEECHQIICEHCSEVFKGGLNQAKRSLRVHIDKVHLGIKHECDVCGKVFLTDKTLASHKRHVHRKEGKYPCKECGRIFGYYLQAVEHAYKDRGEAPHQCKFCDFKSPHSWALSKHRPVCKFKGIPKEFSSNLQQRDVTERNLQERELHLMHQQKFTVRDILPQRL